MQYRGKAAAAAAAFVMALGTAGPVAASTPHGVGYCTPPRAAGHASPARAAGTLPAAAVGPVSRILGRAEPGYRAARAGRQLVTRSGRQHLTARFGRAGVAVRSGPVAVAMRLAGYGYGTRLRPVRLAAPVAHANRVTYRGRRLAQWYANGPAGLEQGFTVTAPPSGAAGHAPLTLALATSGTARATLSHGSVTFRRAGTALAYRNLTVTDARGRHLHAWLALAPGRVMLHADAAGAHYPLTVDPLFQQLAKLTAADGNAGANLGASVAISGNTVAVGAPGTTIGETAYQGAVYVFTMPPRGWTDATQTAKLTASNGGYGDYLGASVAIDRGFIVAGAPGGGSGGGAAYVFTEPQGGWVDGTQTAELTASDGAGGDNLGTSVAINGNTVVAGAMFATVNTDHWRGAAYVFTRPGGGWADENEAAKLTASDGAANDYLGYAVAVAGNTVVAGAPGSASGQGAAYEFTKPGGGWASGTQTAELTAIDGAPGDQLGSAVGVSRNTIVAGAPGAQIGSTSGEGAAYVFTEPNGGWTDESDPAKLTASDGLDGFELGGSVAIDGRTVVAGAPRGGSSCPFEQGTVYVFSEPPGGWASETEFAELSASDGNGSANLGASVGIYGATVVAGAPGARIGDNADAGAAYVFGSPLPRPRALQLAGFLSPGRGSHWRAGTTVLVRTRVEYASGRPIPGWLAAELAHGCDLTVRATGAQSGPAQCMRWNPAKQRFYWAWKTHTKPTGTVTLTVNLYYHSNSTLSEKIVLTKPGHSRG